MTKPLIQLIRTRTKTEITVSEKAVWIVVLLLVVALAAAGVDGESIGHLLRLTRS